MIRRHRITAGSCYTSLVATWLVEIFDNQASAPERRQSPVFRMQGGRKHQDYRTDSSFGYVNGGGLAKIGGCEHDLLR